MRWKKGGDFSTLNEDLGVVRSISFRSTITDDFVNISLTPNESNDDNGILRLDSIEKKKDLRNNHEDVPMPTFWNQRRKSRAPLPHPRNVDRLYTMKGNREVFLAPPDETKAPSIISDPFATSYSTASTLQLVENTDASTPTDLSSTFDRQPWIKALLQSPHPIRNGLHGIWPKALLFCLAGGVANVARLPSVAFSQGGGVFLVAYLVLAFLVGLPLLLLELSLGQFSRSCASKMWSVLPLFKGVGVIQTVASFLLLVSYPAYMAMAFRYLVDAVRGPYPMTKCQDAVYDTCGLNETAEYSSSEMCFVCVVAENSSSNYGLSWRLIICHILSWLFVCLALVKGIRSLCCAALVSLGLVLALQLALFGHFAFLDPSFSNMKFQNLWQWDLLYHSKTWSSALLQLIVSYQFGFGTNLTLAGRFSFRNNIVRTTLIIFFVNLAFGLLSAIVGYQMLGRANIVSPYFHFQELSEFVVIYDSTAPEAGSPDAVWASIAFLSIFISGFISMCVIVWCILRTIVEELGCKENPKMKKILLQGMFVFLAFVLGIACFWTRGLQIIYVIDRVTVASSITSLILLLIGVLWIYGFRNIQKDIEFMTGHGISWIMRWVWSMWCPAVLLGLSIWRLVHLFLNWDEVLSHRPEWVLWLFLTLFILAILVVVLTGVRQLFLQVDYGCLQRMGHAVRPSISWGPPDPFEHHHWLRWKDLHSLARHGDGAEDGFGGFGTLGHGSSASSTAPRRIFVTHLSTINLSKLDDRNSGVSREPGGSHNEDYTET